jgi:CheY-like chemotaxis protein
MQGLSLSRITVPFVYPALFSTGGADDPLSDASLSEKLTGKEDRQLRVLVVDDAPDVLEMFGIMLRLSGYDVMVAPSATEALEQARAVQFDIIVSDIGMPQMNGYELVRRLRELPGYVSVPMIAVTGFAMYKDREQALESGFNAYLSKPVNPINLLDLIEKLKK